MSTYGAHFVPQGTDPTGTETQEECVRRLQKKYMEQGLSELAALNKAIIDCMKKENRLPDAPVARPETNQEWAERTEREGKTGRPEGWTPPSSETEICPDGSGGGGKVPGGEGKATTKLYCVVEILDLGGTVKKKVCLECDNGDCPFTGIRAIELGEFGIDTDNTHLAYRFRMVVGCAEDCEGDKTFREGGTLKRR